MTIYPILIIDGKKIGCCKIKTDSGYLSHFVIYKPFRRKGYGRKLIQLAIAEAKRIGMSYLWLHVMDERIECLYKQFGFVESGWQVNQYIECNEGKLLKCLLL